MSIISPSSRRIVPGFTRRTLDTPAAPTPRLAQPSALVQRSNRPAYRQAGRGCVRFLGGARPISSSDPTTWAVTLIEAVRLNRLAWLRAGRGRVCFLDRGRRPGAADPIPGRRVTIAHAAANRPRVMAWRCGGRVAWLRRRPAEAAALLTDAQKNLTHDPVVTLSIGGHTLDPYVVAYNYEETAEQPGGLAIWLDNRDGNFDDLATDWPNLRRGQAVDLRRGLYINGVATTEKLPIVWVESMQYLGDDGEAVLLLDCIDWRGRLETWRYSTETSFSNVLIETIVASVMSNVGLTLDAGAFAAGLRIDHEINVYQDGNDAVVGLMDKVVEYLYSGLDGKILWKTLSTSEIAGYAYDWSDGGGSGHPCLPGTEIAQSSMEYNKVLVYGGANLQFSGSVEDTTESALTGVRLLVINDRSLDSNAECAARAGAELSQWQARATTGTIVARPHFTLRLYDVVSLAAPPWGGAAITKARVISIREDYGDSEWEQEIVIGELPESSLLAVEKKRKRRGRKGSGERKRRRRHSRARSHRGRYHHRRYAWWPHWHGNGDLPDLVLVPIGGVIFWPSSAGAIPTNWAEYTPLQGRFPVGADGVTFVDGTTGGSLYHNHGVTSIVVANDTHSHGVGTLVLADNTHSHAVGTLAVANNTHNHGNGTLSADNDTHSHNSGTLGTDSDSHAHTFDATPNVQTGTPTATTTVQSGAGSTVASSTHQHQVEAEDLDALINNDSHSHSVNSGSTANNTHNHTVSGSTANDTHGHTLSGSTASDTHNHTISGSTASNTHSHALAGTTDATTEAAVPWLAGRWIQRIA